MVAPRNAVAAVWDMLGATRDPVTNTLLVQIGSVSEELPECDNAEFWQHVGFASRPAKPEAKKNAAQCLALRFGDRMRTVASRDIRGQAIYGNLDDGETCVYGGGPDGTAQGRFLIRKDGSVTMMTTDDNTSDGHTIKRSISPNPLQGIVDFSPWGSAKLNQTGYHIMTASGARLDGGGMTAPGLPSAIGSYWTLSAGSCSLQATTVNLGPTREAQFPIALATPLIAYLTSLVAELAQTITDISLTSPAVGTPLGTTNPAIAADALAIAALVPNPLIASSSTNSN